MINVLIIPTRYELTGAANKPLDLGVLSALQERLNKDYKELLPDMIKNNSHIQAWYNNEGTEITELRPVNFTSAMRDKLDEINKRIKSWPR